MSFGDYLKKVRLEHKDSLRKLGEKLNFNFNYITQIEKGTSPVGKNFISRLIEVYPDEEAKLMELYLKEVLPEKVYSKYSDIIKSSNSLKNNDNLIIIIEFMLQDIDKNVKKDILNYMVMKRENEYYKNGTYEKNKEKLDKIKAEIEKL